MTKFVLCKNLPGCPKGRIFKQDIDDDYFLSMTDDEAINNNLKLYTFTKEEVKNNPKWFVKLLD